MPTPKPLIFLAFANDRDNRERYLRKLPEEMRTLRGILEQAESAGLCRLEWRSNATLTDVVEVFQRHRGEIAVFHFAGHAGSYQLLLEKPGGEVLAADAAGFADFLGQQHGLQLVFLNACSTRKQVEGLQEAGVPAVIATHRAINDAVATEFAVHFYRGLASGASFQTAYHEAQAAVRTEHGGATRDLYWETDDSHSEEDRFPWDIHYRAGAEPVAQWNLPAAVDDPLFGLPPLPDDIDIPQEPFRRLNWFQREHAKVFFGRGKQIRELYSHINSPDGKPLILFYGQTGSGKSSLLDAGLQPRLEQDWQVLYLRREVELGLLGTLQKELTQKARETQTFPNENTLVPLVSLVPLVLNFPEKPLLIILDQVEELYTRPHGDPAQELGALLAALQDLFAHPRPPVKLILGFRKEWLPDIEARIKEHRLPYQSVFLQALDRDGILEAVTGPAKTQALQQQFGLRIEDGLAERIAEKLLSDRNAAIAPTLQILLSKLWDKACDEDYQAPYFSLEMYETLEREGVLLGDFLDQQLKKLEQSHPAETASGLTLDILAAHTTPLGTAAQCSETQLEQDYAHQKGVLPGLLQRCKNLYLLTDAVSKQRNAPKMSRLAHDILAPLVRKQFEESDKPGQRARRVLENRGVDWRDGLAGAPLDEADLGLVESGQAGMRAWDGDKERLLTASRAARERRERNRRVLKAVGLVAVLVIAVSAVVMWVLKEEADKQTGIAQVQTKLAENNERKAKAEAERAQENESKAKAETKRAERQKNNALRNQSYSLAALAEIELNKDKPATAMRLALEALPDSSESYPERPFVAPAYDFLSKSINRQYQGILEHEHYWAGEAMFSSDNRRLLTYNGNNAYLWDVETRQLLHSLRGHTQWITGVAISPDNMRIATVSLDQTLRVWATDSGHELLCLLGHDNAVNSVTFSPDGTRLLTASSDKTGRLWAIHSGKELVRFQGHQGGLSYAIFSPDGTRIVTASNDKTARLWDASNGKELVRLQGQGDVDFVAFSPDGTSIISMSRDVLSHDNTIKVWDASGKHLLARLQGHKSRITSASFSPDGMRIITTSDDKTARLWETDSGEELIRFQGHEGDISSATFSPDGSQIVTTSSDSTARLWRVKDGKELIRLLGHKKAVKFATFSPNGKYIVTSSWDNTIRIWTTERGKEPTSLKGHKDIVEFATFSPDGKYIVTTSRDNTAQLWTSNLEKLSLLHGHESYVKFASFSPDSTFIVTASIDNSARVWAVKSGKELLRLQGHNSSVYSAVFSPDGTRIVTASLDDTARVWEADSGKELLRLQGHSNSVNFATYSPDGTRIATVSGSTHKQYGSIRVWAADSGKELMRLERHKSLINSVNFSQDGNRIVTASSDRSAGVWSLDTGKELARLYGHGQQLTFAAFNPSDTLIVTTSHSNTALLWDASNGRELASLQGHENWITSAAFSSDSQRIITASADGTARIWLTFPSLEEMIDYAQKALPPRDSNDPGDANIPGWRLTCAERKRFFLEEVGRCASVNNETNEQ